MTIRFHPKLLDYLDQLMATGLYGWSRPDVAERLVCKQLQELLGKGDFDRLMAWTKERRRGD